MAVFADRANVSDTDCHSCMAITGVDRVVDPVSTEKFSASRHSPTPSATDASATFPRVALDVAWIELKKRFRTFNWYGPRGRWARVVRGGNYGGTNGTGSRKAPRDLRSGSLSFHSAGGLASPPREHPRKSYEDNLRPGSPCLPQ
jgi:hypothetical protein